MRRDRLQILADKLKSVPVSEFDITIWDCGSAACAGGWACRIPEFNEAGLSIGLSLSPEYKGSYGLHGLMRFFDITWGQATRIFLPDSYESRPSPTDVSDRIEELL